MTSPTRRILVVDPEPVNRRFLQTLFEDDGYTVLVAPSLFEGLHALSLNDVDLVIADRTLPDGTGLAFVYAARSITPRCEVMLVTGYAHLDTAAVALQLGAYDYILKPIEDIDLLLEKTRLAIEMRDLRREILALRHHVASLESQTP